MRREADRRNASERHLRRGLARATIQLNRRTEFENHAVERVSVRQHDSVGGAARRRTRVRLQQQRPE